MKKTLSLFLSLIMLVSAFAMPSGAQAATPNMLTVSVSGTIVDSIVKPAIDEINTYRTEKSIGSKHHRSFIFKVAAETSFINLIKSFIIQREIC